MAFKLKFDKTDVIAVCVLVVGFLFYIGKRDNVVMKEGGHECVDLGLSVYWATDNLDNYDTEAKDCYYAWGAPSLQSGYLCSNYRWTIDPDEDDAPYVGCESVPFMVKKYCTDEMYGVVDSLVQLVSYDDPAARVWGKGWRSPSKEELNELVSKCKWVVRRNYKKPGATGLEAFGPNGKSIFLPMLGYKKSSNHASGQNFYGCYWSSSLDAKNSLTASCLYFANDEIKVKSMFRYLGFSIRPVHDK